MYRGGGKWRKVGQSAGSTQWDSDSVVNVRQGSRALLVHCAIRTNSQQARPRRGRK